MSEIVNPTPQEVLDKLIATALSVGGAKTAAWDGEYLYLEWEFSTLPIRLSIDIDGTPLQDLL